jgi:NAD(P)-dependent dehydrogenase (short-subunit alcohol dehydrogenase family)
VTGAAGGVGAGIAKAMAESAARVIVSDIDGQGARTFCDGLS